MKYRSIVLSLLLALATVWSCKHEPLPNPGDGSGNPTTGTLPSGEICFESQVLPLFQSNCAKSGCHDARSGREGYVLDSYANIMSRGIVPGNAAGSKLYKVLFAGGESKMPPNGNPDLTAEQKSTIGIWINQGAKNTTNCGGASCDSAAYQFTANVKPIINTYCVGCHNSSSAGGGYDLTVYAGVKNAADKGRLYGSVARLAGYVAMPQNGAKLSDCQIAVIRKWIAAGSQNN